jgi:hypothetical protein
MAEVLVSALCEQVAPSSLPSACAALKSIAVNVSFATVYVFLKKIAHLHFTRNGVFGSKLMSNSANL